MFCRLVNVKPKITVRLLDDLKSAEGVRRKETEFLSQRTLLKGKFGSRFVEFDTDWKEILSVLEWTRKAQIVFGSTNMPERLRENRLQRR